MKSAYVQQVNQGLIIIVTLLLTNSMIRINALVSISPRDLLFQYGTSTGPGGQHVNKVATKATLLFDVINSSSLSATQRQRVHGALSTRINKAGVLRVSSSKFRSQRANRAAATTRFVELLRLALKPIKRRKKTGIPTSERRKRLELKKKRSDKKRFRGRVQPFED